MASKKPKIKNDGGEKIIKQTTQECQVLAQELVDDLISKMLQLVYYQKIQFADVISFETFILICHKKLEVLKRSSTLEYIHDPDGMRLLATCMEVMEMCCVPLRTVDGLVNEQSFFSIRRKYSNRDVDDLLFYNLVHVFDYMPLTAIVSDQVLCCHGGISQFAKCREDISGIKRPLKWIAPTNNVLHVAILTDTLWADPRRQGPLYVPSDRHISYFFNKQALMEKLRQFNCRALIRGHESTKGGFKSEFDGLYFTVHTSKAPFQRAFMAGKILLNFNKTTNLVEGQLKYHSANDACGMKVLAKEFIKKFHEIRYMYPMDSDESRECSTCRYFMAGVNKSVFLWERTLHHGDFLGIIKEYQGSELDPFEPEFYASCDQPTMKELSLAARNFPGFLEALIAKNMIPTSVDVVLDPDTRPDYDFTFKLPPAEEDYKWPILEIHK